MIGSAAGRFYIFLAERLASHREAGGSPKFQKSQIEKMDWIHVYKLEHSRTYILMRFWDGRKQEHQASAVLSQDSRDTCGQHASSPSSASNVGFLRRRSDLD